MGKFHLYQRKDESRNWQALAYLHGRRYRFSCRTADKATARQYARGSRAFTVDLHPLNNSGVSGTATLSLDGGELTVTIDATGLEPDKTHAQHIHGNPPGRGVPSNSTCPTAAADANGDGIVDLGGRPSVLRSGAASAHAVHDGARWRHRLHRDV